MRLNKLIKLCFNLPILNKILLKNLLVNFDSKL